MIGAKVIMLFKNFFKKIGQKRVKIKKDEIPKVIILPIVEVVIKEKKVTIPLKKKHKSLWKAEDAMWRGWSEMTFQKELKPLNEHPRTALSQFFFK